MPGARLRRVSEGATQRWGREGAILRYGADPKDTEAWAAQWRSGGTRAGTEIQQLALHHDLGDHHRDRYATYLLHLREVAQGHGIDVPFFVNVHGTEQGRGRSFPIGISQLSRAYAGIPQTTSGSDHYLGELTVENVPDLYVINAFMAAVHDADQPLTSLEFESGTGDYGEDMSRQVTPEAMDLKTRLCVAQGNRLINYYLFSGGHNPPLDAPAGDGNDRIAFTGERHGFAAPVDPEGGLSEGYPALCSTGVRAACRAVADVPGDAQAGARGGDRRAPPGPVTLRLVGPLVGPLVLRAGRRRAVRPRRLQPDQPVRLLGVRHEGHRDGRRSPSPSASPRENRSRSARMTTHTSCSTSATPASPRSPRASRCRSTARRRWNCTAVPARCS
ncbi:hypothetical protein ACWD95_31760 [Streptomyces sp. NPDC005069]